MNRDLVQFCSGPGPSRPWHGEVRQWPPYPSAAEGGRYAMIDRRFARGGFTLIEALVATALLVTIMLAVSQVFSMSSTAAGRVAAHTEAIRAAATFEAAVRNKIRLLKPNSLLIIDSPQPLQNRGDVTGMPGQLTLRDDRIVFFAEGPAGTFESVTDRNLPSTNNGNNDPDPAPAGPGVGIGTATTSSQAVVFFGPSFPDGRIITTQAGPVPAVDASIPAKDWILSQRITLLGVPTFLPAGSFTGETPETAYPLPDSYPLGGLATSPAQGLYACGVDALPESGDHLLARILTNLASNGDGSTITGLFDLCICPSTVSTATPSGNFATSNYDYYRRAGFNLQPRIADVRIEWSDGSVVDPTDTPDSGYQATDPATQWFGARRDTAGAADWTGPLVGSASGDVCPNALWVTAFPAFAGPAFSEFEDLGGTPHSYRAIWTPTTWTARPRALRFTFRVYDSQDRIWNQETVNVTPWNSPPTYAGPLKRYGLEFSFVVEVP